MPSPTSALSAFSCIESYRLGHLHHGQSELVIRIQHSRQHLHISSTENHSETFDSFIHQFEAVMQGIAKPS